MDASLHDDVTAATYQPLDVAATLRGLRGEPAPATPAEIHPALEYPLRLAADALLGWQAGENDRGPFALVILCVQGQPPTPARTAWLRAAALAAVNPLSVAWASRWARPYVHPGERAVCPGCGAGVSMACRFACVMPPILRDAAGVQP